MISVITPVATRQTAFLASAYSSLLRQEVSWEWLLQIDGPGTPLDVGNADERVHVASNGRHLGVSATRNRALLRAKGSHVLSLDADDYLSDGALLEMLDALERTGGGYAIGETVDVFPDGQLVRRFTRRPYAAGPLEVGVFESEWRRSGNIHIQPGATLYRRHLVLASGGWPAISGMEDQDLLFAVSTGHPGVYLPKVVYMYRQHPLQTVRSSAFARDRALHRMWCDARLRATRRANGEDVDELADLTTPLPSAAQIRDVTTDEWKSQQAAQLGLR